MNYEPEVSVEQQLTVEKELAHREKISVCLLGASLDAYNLGVSALTISAIKCILHRFPAAEISLLDYALAPTVCTVAMSDQSVSIPVVNMRFSKRLLMSNNIVVLLLLALLVRLVPVQTLRRRILSTNPCLSCLGTADLVGAISGGDSLTDIYGWRRFFYISFPQLLALLMGKRLVLLPQTLGPFSSSIARWIARYVFKHAFLIYSRDYAGFETVAALIGRDAMLTKTRFCYDLAFILDPTATEMEIYRNSGNGVVGVNISGLLLSGGYTRDNMFGLKIDYEEFVYELIDFLIRDKGTTVLLVPHVFGPVEDLENDAAICGRLFAELKPKYGQRILLAAGPWNEREAKYIIGLCDFFVGSRMHACIAALSQGVPAVPLAYSNKFVGVLRSAGLESLCADARGMDKEEILQLISDAMERGCEIRHTLEEKLPEIKRTILDIFWDMELPLESIGLRNASSGPTFGARRC